MVVWWIVWVAVVVEGLRIATVTQPLGEGDNCPDADMTFLASPVYFNCPGRIIGTTGSYSFSTTELDEAVVTYLDRTVVASPLTSLEVSERNDKWRILFLRGELTDDEALVVKSDWRMDAVLSVTLLPSSLTKQTLVCDKALCTYDLNEQLVETTTGASISATRIVQYKAVNCEGPSQSLRDGIVNLRPPLNIPFSVGIRKIAGSTFCVVGIDARMAHFDAQLEWLQATLAEPPCRESEWQLVFVSGGRLDSAAASLIDNNAIVDLVIGDFSGSTPSLPDGAGRVMFTETSMSLSASCDPSSNTITVQSKRTERQTNYPWRTTISRTPNSDILWALALTAVSGIAVNLALRRTLALKAYDPLSLA